MATSAQKEKEALIADTEDDEKDPLAKSKSNGGETDTSTQSDSFPEMVRNINAVGVPNAGSYILEMFVDTINYYFMGKEGNTLHFAAFGMGNMWFNLTAYAEILGMISAVDTLVSQSLGRGLYSLCGIYYIRATAILKVGALLLSILQPLAYPVLMLFNLDKELAWHSTMAAVWNIPTLFLLPQFELTRVFLFCHKVVIPQFVVQIVGLLAHIGWSYFFISYLDMYYIGAGLAKAILYITNLALLFIYIKVAGVCKESFQPCSCEAFRDWGSFLSIAIPGAIMSCTGWCVIEAVNLLTGSFGPIYVSATSIFWNIDQIVYLIGFGMGIGTGVYVGTSLGAGNKEQAKRYCKVGILFFLIVGLVIVTAVFLLKEPIAAYYTVDSDVKSLVTSLMWISMINSFLYTLQGFLQCILICMSQQGYAAILAVLLAVYNLSLSWLMGIYFNYRLLGLKVVFVTANLLLILVYGIRLTCIRWDSLVREIAVRSTKDMEKLNGTAKTEAI